MKPFARSDRVGGHIQKVLSEILHKHVKDPRLEKATITAVKVSSDLKSARIYFITSGDTVSKKEVAEGFKNACGFVKRSLARQLSLRYMPELKFYYDDSYDYGSHIDNILKLIKAGNGSDNTTIEKQ